MNLFINSTELLSLFIAFKNGPYAIFTIEGRCEETYRSSASYKDSIILNNNSGNSFFIVQTSAGIFSINFIRETQETWFLVEEEAYYLLSNTKKDFIIAL